MSSVLPTSGLGAVEDRVKNGSVAFSGNNGKGENYNKN
jgi:hypothetical protein